MNTRNRPEMIKVGRTGVVVKGSRIPTSFFRHQQPGKSFVVLAGGDRRLMHVLTKDMERILRAYRAYLNSRKTTVRRATAR